jgi:hypothetical protein
LCHTGKGLVDKRYRFDNRAGLFNAAPNPTRTLPRGQRAIDVGARRAAPFWAKANDEWVVIVERIVSEADLAWALAEVTKPHLSAVERYDVFMAIGAGETFAAIRQLFSCVAIKGIPVGLDLVERCTTWLHAYAGHEDERYLRRLIENFLIPLPFSDHTFIRVHKTRQHRCLVSSSIARTAR